MKKSLLFTLFLLMKASVIFAGVCNFCGHDLNEKAECPYEEQHSVLRNTIEWILDEESVSSEDDQLHDGSFGDVDLSFWQPLGQSNAVIPNLLSVNGHAVGQIQLSQPVRVKPYFGADGELLQIQNNFEEWKQRVKEAKRYPDNSQNFVKFWKQNYQFATNLLSCDLHFYLNTAVCLTKLGHLTEALNLLEYALTIDKIKQDLGLSFAIKRQMAFIYGLQTDWENALQTYRQIFPFGAVVGRFIDFITQAIDAVLSSGVLPENEVDNVKQWKCSLKAIRKRKQNRC